MLSNRAVPRTVRARPAPPQEPDGAFIAVCANCGGHLSGPNAVPRAQPTAWHGQCLACEELTKDQLELLYDRPGDAPIQIHQCRRCGETRSCRPGWQTRCHICLDERSADLDEASQECLGRFALDPLLALQVGRNMHLPQGEPITPRAIVEATSLLTVATERQQYERPGWTVIASDIYGLPWTGVRTHPTSHGTWGLHEVCGSVAKLRKGPVDCPSCGPQPGSRTHKARQDEKYLLYLVTIKRVQKFGVGTQYRVREHQRGGAVVVQVLQGAFAEVVMAERKLKKLHGDHSLHGKTRRLPASFGQGTEVLRNKIVIDLIGVLPGGEDVTSWFSIST